jgi:glycosyltransferase involved in cell wall biosynthesis
MKKLSLVIPCYNEIRSLPSLVERCSTAFTRSDTEVVLVDNGSTDGSAGELLRLLEGKPNLRTVLVEKNQGYGFGILSGLRAAEGRFLGWSHADLQTDPADAIRALEILERSSEPNRLFIKGKRYGRPVADVFFTVGMSLFESALLGTRFWDINAQPNIFSRQFFDSWDNPPHDFSLDLFAYHAARRAGLEVVRFPVAFENREHGTSHWNVNWAGKFKFIKRTVEFSLAMRRVRR